MSIVRNFEDYLRYEIENNRKVPLRKKGLVISDPVVPSTVGLSTARNTAVFVEFDERAFVVTYNRSDIATLFGAVLNAVGFGMTIRAPSVMTTRDLIPDLNRNFNLNLKPADILDEALSIKFSTTAVTIKIAPTCLWFNGQVNIPLKGKYEQVGTELLTGFDGSLLGFLDNSALPNNVYARAGQVTHAYDYSAQQVALRAIPYTQSYAWSNITPANAQALAAALNLIDNNGWTYNASSAVQNNLLNGCVAYNGPVEGLDVRTDIAGLKPGIARYLERFGLSRKDLSWVMAFQFNPTSGTPSFGTYPMFIHYGEKVAKTHFTQEDTPPVHWWKLNKGDRANYGSSEGAEEFPDILNFYKKEGRDWAQLKVAGNFPLPISWETERDFTVSIDLFRQDRGTQYEGIFGIAAGTEAKGGMKFGNGSPYISNATSRWSITNQLSMLFKQWCRLVFVRRGQVILTYINGKCVNESLIATTDLLLPWTHFGKVNQNLGITTGIGEIKLYDYALNKRQVKLANRGLL